MVTKSQIENFYQQGPFALIGVSRNKRKLGRLVFDELKEKGMKLLPVNPNAETIEGEKCYKDIASLPDEVKAVIIITKKNLTLDITKQAIAKGMKHLWIQRASATPEALEYAAQHKVNLIHGKCILMFAEPVNGKHKIHRAIVKLFGQLPK